MALQAAAYEPCQMDFDDRDPATEASTLMSSGAGLMLLERLVTEAAECDVVCANCQRMRTYRRRKLQDERE